MSIFCPKCNQELSLDAIEEGRHYQCPTCEARFVVRSGEAELLPDQVSVEESKIDNPGMSASQEAAVTSKMKACWAWAKPLLLNASLFAARAARALFVWVRNWTLTNWQAGRNGRIKVVVAGAVVFIAFVRLFFGGGGSNIEPDEVGSSVATACRDPKTVEEFMPDMDYEPNQDYVSECIERTHSFRRAIAITAYSEVSFELRALLDGHYNYIVYSGGDRFFGLGEVSMVVFNDADAVPAFFAYKSAIRKAREWIETGRANNTTLTTFRDMGIVVPDGSAIRLGEGADKWILFNDMADIPNHKKGLTRFEFYFTEKTRCLRLNCGDIVVDKCWDAKDDEKELAQLESACDIVQLFHLIKGRDGEAAMLRVDRAYNSLPEVSNVSKAIPEWCAGDASFLHDFPGNHNVSVSHDGEGGYNYAFSECHPPWQGEKNFLHTSYILIFPDDSYDAAYRALGEAYRIALGWRDIAKAEGVLNLIKEIRVPCPDSVGVRVVGIKNFKREFWDAIGKYYPAESRKPTRFWFLIETEPTRKDHAYVYKTEDTKCYLCFGNENAVKCLRLDDQTIAAFERLDPQQALQALRDKKEAEKIFR